MLDLKTARSRILSQVIPVSSERVPTSRALGRVLRRALTASVPMPRFDVSAMDGYAVRGLDVTPGAVLPVVGEARTGRAPGQLAAGCATRIFTGAALPEGADTVVMQERVAREGERVTFEVAPRVGENVRLQGEELPLGVEALPAGSRLTPGALMLAASLDRATLVVSRRPRVTILCTGDELRENGEAGPLGTIPESNSPGLGALAQLAGAEVTIAPLVVDEPELVRDAVTQALQGADVLVTVGGVSVGDHDHVRTALQEAGVSLDFWMVALKPGKPLAFGRLGHQHVLALPGNPASALVTFALFGMPLLRKLQACCRSVPLASTLPCAVPLKRHAERDVVCIGNLVEHDGLSAFLPHPNQSSGATLALGTSDGLALLAKGNSTCEAGTLVPFFAWSSL